MRVRHHIKSINPNEDIQYVDANNGIRCRGILTVELKQRLVTAFGTLQSLKLFRKQKLIFVHEIVFTIDIEEEGILVDPDVILPNDLKGYKGPMPTMI